MRYNIKLCAFCKSFAPAFPLKRVIMALQILIADDAPHISRSLSFILQREGFSVDVASNGEETLQKIREERPKVVFLDIVMPKMTGLDLCKEIKTDPLLKDTYIIILTAKGGE